MEPMAQPSASAPETSASSSGGIRGQVKSLPPWGKALLGCGVGCLGVSVIGVILFSIAAYYAVSPGEQIDTRLIAGPESRAVLRLYGGRPDSQLAPFLVMVMTEAQRADRNNQNLPEPLKWLADANDAQQAQQLEQWLDLEATVTFEEGRLGPQPVAAINLPVYARAARWALSLLFTPVSHAGYHYYQIDPNHPAVMSFAENTMLWAADEQSLKVVLDRLSSGQTSPLPPAFQEPLAELEGRWDFYGVGDRSAIPTDRLDDDDVERVEGWDLGLAAAGEESVEGRFTIYFVDSQAALDAEPRLQQHLRSRQEDLRQDGLTTTFQVRRLGSQVVIDFSLLSLRSYLAGVFSRLEDEETKR